MNKDKLLTMFNENESRNGGMITKIFNEGLTRYVNSNGQATINECLCEVLYEYAMSSTYCTSGFTALITRYQLTALVNIWMQMYIDGKLISYTTIALTQEHADILRGAKDAMAQHLITVPVGDLYIDYCIDRVSAALKGMEYKDKKEAVKAVEKYIYDSLPRLKKDMVECPTEMHNQKLNYFVDILEANGSIKIKKSNMSNWQPTPNDFTEDKVKGRDIHGLKN